MKKSISLVALLFLALGGITVWLFLRPPAPQPEPPQQPSTAKIRIHVSSTALEQAKTSKALAVSVTIEGTNQVSRVDYALDGAVTGRSIEPPFSTTIYIHGLKEGGHTLQATAYNTASKIIAKSDVFTFTLQADASVTAPDVSSQSNNGSGTTPIRTTTANKSVSTTNNQSPDTGGGNPPDEEEPAGSTRTAGGWWASLPSSMQVCSSNRWNGGPSSAPAGAITVPAGDNTSFNFNQANKTFWFAPGEHTLGTGEFSQITAGNNSTYIGAPGAILDGKNNNRYAFTGTASNVRIAYLEIRNFGRGLDNNNEGVINHDSGTGWVMENLYAHHNDGAAVFIGSDNTVQYNCLKDNGQYGFSMFKPQVEGASAITDIVIDHNEIVGNNQDDWESIEVGCGCTGGGKFWDVKGATVTNNYVHDNLSTGLWADTNDIDFLFDSNWIEHNQGEGIWYEISYNATISRNVIKRNAWTTGVNNQGSPGPAVYISESGGDSRLQSSTSGSTSLRINNNLIEDNFSGVSIFENSNRFCNSNGNTSKTYCTPFVTPTIIPSPYNFTYPNPINSTHPCYTNVTSEPYTTNCRWHSKNVQVYNNEFRFNAANVPCAGNYCGVQALFATGANNISWAPTAYNIANVQNNVMFNNNNSFYNNTYVGNWRFVKGSGERINWDSWRTGPFNQDSNSTFDPDPIANYIDTNTSTLEGTIGQWQNWFNTSATRSNLEAHSGSYSLRINATAGGSWGADLANWPGFDTASGPKRISFWAKKGSGTISSVMLRVKWLDSSGSLLQTNDVPLGSLSSTWQQAQLDVTAPILTNTVVLELHGSGSNGDVIYVDDVIVGDN